MTPIYLNPSPSPFPPVEPSEVQQLLFGDQPTSQSASSSSSISCPIFFNPSVQDQVVSYDSELQQQEEADKYVLSSDLQFLPISPSPPTVETHESNYGLKLSICNKREDKNGNQSYNGSVKWMSSKMRLMKKMMKSSNGMVTEKPIRSKQKFHDQQRSPSSLDTDNNSNNNTIIRVCTDCNTTKTPLWRSGPSGPKSLCNACGIRQRKARRAMAAAATATATAASGTLLATETSSTVHRKEKVSNNGCIAQYKKRCKLTVPPQSSKKLCFEDFTISLSKNSAFHRVFPQDEKEAAILLMALSCGLVHG